MESAMKKEINNELESAFSKSSSDLKNEKYAGVTYPKPPTSLEMPKKDFEKKKTFGKNLIINFFTEKKNQ